MAGADALEISRRFDAVMADRPSARSLWGADGSAKPYVPQGLDPKWRLDGALVAAERMVEHSKVLGGLPPLSPHERKVAFKGRKRETHRLLADLRAAADEIERLLTVTTDGPKL